MGVSYQGMKLVWLKQSGGRTTTMAWISPDEGSLGVFAGGSNVSVPVKVRVINGPKPVFSLANGQLPPGLTFSTETGSISGLPENANGDYSFTLRATSGETTIERAFQIAVATNLPPVWVTPTGSLGQPFDSTDYDYTLEATDPEGQPVTYSLVTGSLPGGLKLNADTGEITGRLRYVSANTTFFFTVRASDGIATTNESFNITVKANEAPFWITPISNDPIVRFIEGVEQSFTFVAQDPEGNPLTYSIARGTLPDGFALDAATGVLSGTLATISTNRTITLTLLASDGVKGAERTFTIGLAKNLPPIWSLPTPAVTEVSGYSVSFPLLAADPNGKPLTFSVTEGSELPAGFTLFNGTIIAPLPEVSVQTDYTFSITASDGLLSTDKEIVVRSLVNTPPVWATPSDLGEVLEGAEVSIQLYGTDPEGKPVTYTATSELPDGLALATGGRIVGTPVDVLEDTSFEFSVELSDGVNVVERDFTLLVKVNVAPVWVTPAGSLGIAYGQESFEYLLDATDANGENVFMSVTSGQLPPGLTLSGRTIQGYASTIINADTDYTFTISASDGPLGNHSVPRTFTITHGRNLPLVWETAAGRQTEAFEKTPVSFTVKAIDPEGKQVRYGIPNGTQLPMGFGLNANTGTITGTVPVLSQDSEISFTILASVAGQAESARIVRTFSILGKFNTAPEFTSAALMNIVEGRSSTLKITAENPGNGPMVYTVVSGALPAGLTLQPNGNISGFAPAAAVDTDYTFTVRANNGIKTTEQVFTVSVKHNLAPVWATNAGSLGTIFGGVQVQFLPVATDANGQAVFYSLVSGALPAGMALNPATGVIIGTPNVAAADATSTFTLGASDGVLRTDRQFSITVSANTAPTWATPAGSLGEVVRNKVFSIQLDAADSENRPLTYSIVGGQLPQGILLNPNTGAIVGRAPDVSQDETYSFTVRVSDGALFSERAFSIDVNVDAAPVWQTAAGSLGSVLSGYGASFTVTAEDPEGLPLTYSMISGSLPQGWSFNAVEHRIVTPEGGSITTSADETFSFTIRADDGQVFSDRQFSVSLLKNLKPTWNAVYNTALGSLTERTDIDFTVQATDPETAHPNTPDVTYVVSEGALPGGISLNSQTGRISGKLQFVTEDTDFAFTIEAFDGRLYSDPLNYTITVLFDSPPIWQTAAGSLGTSLEDTEVTYTVAATSNGGEVIYGLKFGSTLPGTLTIDDETGVISGMLPLVELPSVDYTFTLTATGGSGKTSERTFTIVVQDNLAPTWVTTGGLLITDLAGTPFSFVLTATDANGTPITYSIVDGTLPEGVTFDTTTHVLSGTLPLVETDTTYAVTIGASDGKIRTDREFRFRSQKDTAPTWTTAAFLGDFIEQRAFSTTLVATDAQGKAVTYSLKAGSTLPGTLSLVGSPIGGQTPVPAGRLSGTLPANEIEGTTDTYSFTIVANDGTQTFERQFSIGVRHNAAPVWNTAAGALGNVVEGQAFTSTLNATDTEGFPVTYSLAPTYSLPAGLTLNSATGAISGSPSSVAADTVVSFVVRASDDLRFTDRSFSITVLNAVAPVDAFSDEVGLLIQMNGDYSDNTGKIVYGTNNAGKLNLWYTNKLRNDITGISAGARVGVVTSSMTNSGKGSLDFRSTDQGRASYLNYGGGLSNNGYAAQINLQDFTIEGWIKFTPRGTEKQTFFSHMVNGGTQNNKYGLAVQYRPGVGMVAMVSVGNIDNDPPFATIAGNFADDQWHHVAVTREGADFRLFVDGVSSTVFSNSVYSIDHYLIGDCYLGNSMAFTSGLNGYVDGFRLIMGEAIYTSAFTPSATLAFSGGPSVTSDNALTDFGQSLKIETAGQGLSIPYYADITADADDEITIEAWVRPADNTTNGAIFAKSSASLLAFQVAKSATNYELRFFYNSTNFTITASNTVVAGTWQHIAMVLKRGASHTMTLFVDGVSHGSSSIQNGAPAALTDEAFFIGTNRSKASFIGQIDEVRITKGARYQANFTPAAIQTDGLPRFNNAELVGSTEKQAANYDVTADDVGNSGSMTYSVTPALPTGLSLSPTTGMITGINPDTTLSPFTFTVLATDGKGNKQKRLYSVSPIQDTAPSALTYSWRFNERAGPVTTTSVNPNVGSFGGTPAFTGTLSHVAAPDRAGEFALNLKGGHFYRNSLGTSLSVLNNNTFTLEGWFRTTATYTGGLAPTFISVATNNLRFYVNPGDGKLGFCYNGSAGGAGTPAPVYTIPLNTWQHVAMVREGTGIGMVKVYINGSLAHTFDSGTLAIDNLDFGSVANLTDYLFPTDTYMRNWNIYSVAKYTANFTPTFDSYNDPIWASSSNLISNGNPGDGISAQLVAEKAGTRTLTYSSTAIPSGVTLSSAGALGGVYPADTTAISVVATDNLGSKTNSRSFAIPVVQPFVVDPFALYTRTLFPMTGANGTAPVDVRRSVAPITYFTNGAAQASIQGAQTKWGSGALSTSGAHINNTAPSNGLYSFASYPSIAMGQDDFTVEAWVYPTAQNTSSGRNLIWSWYPVSPGIVLMLIGNSGSPLFASISFGNGDTVFTGTTVVPLNQWTHLAMSRESNAFRLYVNGVRQTATQGTSLTSSQTVGSATQTFDIGGFTAAPQFHAFKGYINDLRVTHRKARYTGASFTVPTQALDIKGPNGVVPPVYAWTFNKPLGAATSATVALEAGVSHSALIFTGTPTFTSVAGGARNAITFASGTKVVAGAASELTFLSGDFTWETWVNPTSLTGAFPTFMHVGNTNTNQVIRVLSDVAGNATTCLYNGASASFPSAVTTGSWQHLAVVKSGNTITSYRNGIAGPATTVTSPASTVFTNQTVNVNGHWTDGSASSAASYADFGFSRYAKYTGPFTPPTSPPADSFGF